ncbi:hypothetical protein EG68_03873 [Paragonimus skrjabini miyazakii]|uniref:Uncharacterized protein n=1 Tax=Paragonimus skrjabini miyazakii TaxID=59628 RepID=A0A8S9Z0A6_9TREM|nr:hypothetical protein EG68_03873 [Paragonimus skrjabini miyazakii]
MQLKNSGVGTNGSQLSSAGPVANSIVGFTHNLVSTTYCRNVVEHMYDLSVVDQKGTHWSEKTAPGNQREHPTVCLH